MVGGRGRRNRVTVDDTGAEGTVGASTQQPRGAAEGRRGEEIGLSGARRKGHGHSIVGRARRVGGHGQRAAIRRGNYLQLACGDGRCQGRGYCRCGTGLPIVDGDAGCADGGHDGSGIVSGAASSAHAGRSCRDLRGGQVHGNGSILG